jgi:hypothetical protein
MHCHADPVWYLSGAQGAPLTFCKSPVVDSKGAAMHVELRAPQGFVSNIIVVSAAGCC